MSRPQRKTLTAVTVGPYRPSSSLIAGDGDQNLAPPVTVGLANLYDPRMGALNERGRPVCEGDHAACFGRMGSIPLKSYMLNPAMEDPMLQFLKLFQYQADGTGHSWLEMREGIYNYVQKHRTLTGFRKLKAIAAEIATSNWRVWPEGGGVRYVVKERGANAQPINISGIELRNLLIAATRRYSNREDTNVTLEDVGINTEISKPEDFVIGSIPVLPNTMRIPSSSQFANGGEPHPYSSYYAQIIQANQSGRIEDVRTAYLNLINKGETHTLKADVFTSNKKAFVRGSMFAKVGGQIARSVVTPNPDLRPDEVGIPRHLARDVSQRVMVTEDNMAEIISLIEQGHVNYIFHVPTREYIRIDKIDNLQGNRLEPGRTLVLRELRDGDFVLANRQPTLHKNSILGFIVKLHDGDTIQIHPSASTSFGADWTKLSSIPTATHLNCGKFVSKVMVPGACQKWQITPSTVKVVDKLVKMERLGDIYLIRHMESNRYYVGQAVQEKISGQYAFEHGHRKRIREHFVIALSDSPHNNDIPKLYAAIREFGTKAFLGKRVETCPISMLDERERWWIRVFDCINSGFNTLPGGSNSQARSESIIETWKDPEYRQKQTDTHTEQWKTDEYRDRYFSAVQSRVRDNGLPHNIYLSRKKGIEVGYEVTIKRNKQTYSKKFTSTKISMEQKLEMAIAWRDQMLASLGNNP